MYVYTYKNYLKACLKSQVLTSRLKDSIEVQALIFGGRALDYTESVIPLKITVAI
jgi:hypothetical protein